LLVDVVHAVEEEAQRQHENLHDDDANQKVDFGAILENHREHGELRVEDHKGRQLHHKVARMVGEHHAGLRRGAE
jgi:hypothetical protein